MQRIKRLLTHAAYLRRSSGVGGFLRRALAKALSPVYKRRVYYVANHSIHHQNVPETAAPAPGNVRGVAIDSSEAFDAIGHDLHPHFDAEHLRRFLSESPKRFLILGEVTLEDGTLQYVSQRSCEQGVFEVKQARQYGTIPDNIMMIFNAEVAPEYRGRGMTQKTRPGMYKHCRRIGVDQTTSVIAAHNRASIRAHKKQTSGMSTGLTGRIVCVEWLGGLVVRKTPWEEVLAMIKKKPGQTDPSIGADAVTTQRDS